MLNEHQKIYNPPVASKVRLIFRQNMYWDCYYSCGHNTSPRAMCKDPQNMDHYDLKYYDKQPSDKNLLNTHSDSNLRYHPQSYQ